MNNKDIYDKLYELGYHSNFDLCHTLRLLANLHYFPNAGKILDVGCSHGAAVQELQKRGYEAYGIDIADKAIEYCKHRGLTTCAVASATKIPFDDKFFDLIVSSDTLEHLQKEDVPKMVSEFRRVSKQGCLLSIACDEEGGKEHLNALREKHDEYKNLAALHSCIMTPEQWDEEFLKQFSSMFKISYFQFEYMVMYI